MRLGALGRVEVTFGGGDNRALHEDLPGAREGLGVAQAGLVGPLARDGADVVQVAHAGLADGARGAKLQEHLDERTGVKVLRPEQSSNTSKTASILSSGVAPRRLASASIRPRVQRSSRRSNPPAREQLVRRHEDPLARRAQQAGVGLTVEGAAAPLPLVGGISAFEHALGIRVAPLSDAAVPLSSRQEPVL